MVLFAPNESKDENSHQPGPLEEDEKKKNRLLACGLWLFGCTCWVVGYLYANVNNISPQVTNIWRASLMISLNYTIAKYENKTLDIPKTDYEPTQYKKYTKKFKKILFETFNRAQKRI